MWKKLLNILKYLLFLSVGIFIFWRVYKDEPLGDYKEAFKHLNYFWILLSVFFSILSQISRAIRWNMLIRPLGYQPKVYNSYLSVLILYFVNLLLPRAGEVARCTVLGKYEKIPFAKLAGTVFVERMADLITLMILAIIILVSQLNVFITFFNSHEDIRQNAMNLFSFRNLVIGVAIMALFVLALLLFRRYMNRNNNETGNVFAKKMRQMRQNFIEGIQSIIHLENKWAFVGHTIFIFVMWLFMLYVIFKAYPPTQHLSLQTGMITFLMGGLAMLAPVQGGIGPWHFMVYETLFIYGIAKKEGKVFALIAHASTNLIYLFFGLIALLIIPLINRNRREVTQP